MNGVMGGLERQIIAIGDILQSQGHSVFVVTLDTAPVKSFYSQVDSKLIYISVNKGNPDFRQNGFTRISRQIEVFRILRRLKPDIGVAFMFGGFLMSRLSMFLIGKPLILAERNSPDMYSMTRISKIRHILFLIMFFADKITVQFDSYRYKYPVYLRHKIYAIPNTIHSTLAPHVSRQNVVRYVYAGRFSFQKQIVRLLDSFIDFHRDYPNTKLTIYGEGELKSEIVQRIDKLKLEKFIVLAGPSEIDIILGEADVVCVPSKWEGFPNVLAESLSAGIPAIGFANCDGVRNLLIDNVNGWIEIDKGEKSEILELLIRSYNGVVNGDLSRLNIVGSVQKYEKKAVTSLWNSLLLKSI
jgi:glycosyltransferase involved in cell wall biosynthesis